MGNKNSQIVTLNLNTEIKKVIHLPRSSDGFPLYTKAPGYKCNLEENKAEESERYKIESKDSYNSPRNLRKIFITGSGVGVQYYSSMIIHGAPGKTKYSFRNYKCRSLFEVAVEQLEFREKLDKLIIEKTVDSRVKRKLDEYKIEGSMFSPLVEPICSNIEEIYLDWTPFLSSDPRLLKFNFSDNDKIGFLTKQEQLKLIQNDLLRDYFIEICCKGIKNFRERFPRLRLIAMISKLDDILKHDSNIIVDQRFSEISPNTWFKANAELIKQSNSVILYSDISSDIKFPNLEFKTDEGIYLFDKRLAEVFQSHNEKIKRNANHIEDEGEGDTELTELESLLVGIEKKHKENSGRMIQDILGMSLGTGDFTKEQIVEELKKMKRVNRERYAKILGIKL